MGTYTGVLLGAHDDYELECGDVGGLDRLYTLTVPAMKTLVIDTDNTTADTLLGLLESTCTTPELECNDDDGATTGASRIERADVAAGTYVIVVDGYDAIETGAYNLHVSGTIAAGGSCEGPLFASGAFTCEAGFLCDGTTGARTCRTQCSDGADNNGDGKIDFPADPGCSSPADNAETTVCPGAACPQCSDGMDNDGDQLIDYPLDPGCQFAGQNHEACAESDVITTLTTPTVMGNTATATHDFVASCGADNTVTAPDLVYALDLPALDSISVVLTNLQTGFDTVHSLLPASCGAPELNCVDGTTLTKANLNPGRYYVVVDGYNTGDVGTFTMTVSGKVAQGGSCEGPLFASGALTCAAGMCQGPAGMKTCSVQCSDGVDNNGSGGIDYPNDPGCTSPSDATEDTVTCPGAMCPACANGVDDNTNTFKDYPADFGCGSAAQTTEAFCSIDLDFGGKVTQPVTQGSLVGGTGDYNQPCQSTTGHDTAYSLVLPVPVASLTVDTNASTGDVDTVLSFRDAGCGNVIACNDDFDAPNDIYTSSITRLNVPVGNYAISVDSFGVSSNNLPFTLTVRGTVAAGTACTSPLFTSGVLACATGTSCMSGTCQ